MMGKDGVGVLAITALFLDLPYRLMTFVLYRPFYQGAIRLTSLWDSRWIWRVVTLYVVLFVLSNLSYCIYGQLMFDRWRGDTRSWQALVFEGFAKAWRSAWICIPTAVATYFLFYHAWAVPAFPLIILGNFVLPEYVLDRVSIRHAWSEGMGILKDRLLAISCTAALICVAELGARAGLSLLQQTLQHHLPLLWQILLPAPLAIVLMGFLQIFQMSLYMTAAEQKMSPIERIQAIFE